MGNKDEVAARGDSGGHHRPDASAAVRIRKHSLGCAGPIDCHAIAGARSHTRARFHISVFIVKTQVTVLWKSHSVFSDSLLIIRSVALSLLLPSLAAFAFLIK